MSLYIVEVFHDNIANSVVFEKFTHRNDGNEVKDRYAGDPNMKFGKQITWKSMYKNERPIRVISINGLPVENGYAVAYVLEWDYGGTTLTSIHLDGTEYVPESGVYYWFPGFDKPEELVDGSMRVYMNKSSDLSIVFLTPLHSIPFMDEKGTFTYEYKMISKDVRLPPKPKTYKYSEYPRCDIPVTIYQMGDKFKTMLDKTTMLTHSIEFVYTLHEIPVYYLQ